MTAANEAPELLLQHHLKKLRLPTVLREYEKLARQCAAENVDHVRYLARLIELELIDREARMVDRRIKAARFPAIKSLESFDFDAIPTLNKKLVLDLARSEFVDRRENIIALGPSGAVKPMSPSVSDWRPASMASKPASPPPPTSFMDSSRPVTTNASCVCKGNSPATSC